MESETVQKIAALEAQNKILQTQIDRINDIEEIKILQHCYGYYLEHFMVTEFADLFANDPDAALHMIGGKTQGLKGASQVGKEEIKKGTSLFSPESSPNPETLHSLTFSSGIVHVAEDGKTAKGRWYGQAAVSTPHGRGINESFSLFLYENDYVKQNGVWKFKTVRCHIVYTYQNPQSGFVNPARFWTKVEGPDFNPEPPPEAMVGPSFDVATEYPSGYIVPFHFKHPVTDTETSEKKRNKALGLPMPDIY